MKPLDPMISSSAAQAGQSEGFHRRPKDPFDSLASLSRSGQALLHPDVGHSNDETTLENQQHEVERLGHLFTVNRRDLFKLLGAGLLVGVCAPSALTQESGRTRNEEIPQDLESWVHIGADGKITVFTGKVEMGQNIRTSLTQQVAEELRAPVSAIALIMGDTSLVPFDMGTFGSRTTPQMGTQLRNAAAAAREILLDMAAERWKADRTQLSANDGVVTSSRNSEKLSYGELTQGQKLVKVLKDPALTPATQWKVAGTATPKVDGKAFVTGAHQYTSDLLRPGMLYGKVLRPKAFNAKLVSLDANDAEKLADVKIVRDGDFVGLTAPDPEIAAGAVDLIKAQWNAPQQISEAALFDSLRQGSETGSAGRGSNRETGSVGTAMASAAKTLSQTYTVAYIQHAPLEPRAALAEWQDNKLTVWTGTQRPFAVREELASAFHIPLDQVRVIVPDTGSAYGGKHTGDAAVEAARLAKAAGKPVKLVWTREEEFTWAYFRPAGVIDVKSGIAADGTLTAWEFHNYNSGPAAIGTPYSVANQKIEFHPAKNPPLRQGSYRGLAATANHFARESAMDELAALAAMDTLKFRLKNMTDTRLRDVFNAAAQAFGWGEQPATPTRGFGIAGGFEKGGYLATCAEVAVDRKSGGVKIVRVVQSFDCGAIINPNGLRNQMEGAIVQGIGGAIFEAVHFENGRILNPHFGLYRVPRFRDLPQIKVELVDRKDMPSMGAGETPLMGLAPAVAGAIFSATGIRLRSLPLLAKPLKLTS
ncbi:MAG TPA: molybdopterin cofactor-binding domain-containing protein [Candidatus Angelobacter sp.]|nr:molybdopterin cofactor-binding domain-containing protein [Candidatus Angelobacter sp.]